MLDVVPSDPTLAAELVARVAETRARAEQDPFGQPSARRRRS